MAQRISNLLINSPNQSLLMHFHSEEIAQLTTLKFPEGINSHLSLWNFSGYIFFLICHFTFCNYSSHLSFYSRPGYHSTESLGNISLLLLLTFIYKNGYLSQMVCGLL